MGGETVADRAEVSGANFEVGVVPTERLEADLTRWAADIAAAEARWLGWLAEYDRREGWASWGVRSAAHWLNWKCGMSLHAAQEKVRTARALVDLPELRGEMEAGRVSYSKVRAVTRVATPADEGLWVSLASASTASQLERMVAGQRRVNAAADASRVFEARSVSRRDFDDGRCRISVDVPVDVGEMIWAGLEQAVEAIIDDAVGDGDVKVSQVVAERGGRAALRADALVNLATDAVTAGDAVDADRDRRVGHLHLIVELPTPAAELHDGSADVAVLLNDRALAGPVGERWCCDIDTSAIAETSDAVPVGETDKRRTPNRAMRRRLGRRAGQCCEIRGCEAQRFLQAHHIIHWIAGGPTELWNLLLVCGFHHHLLHEGGWSVTGRPGFDLEFVPPASRRSAPRGEQPRSDPDRLVDGHRQRGFRPQLDCEWDGSPPDYGLISELVAWESARNCQ